MNKLEIQRRIDQLEELIDQLPDGVDIGRLRRAVSLAAQATRETDLAARTELMAEAEATYAAAWWRQ